MEGLSIDLPQQKVNSDLLPCVCSCPRSNNMNYPPLLMIRHPTTWWKRTALVGSITWPHFGKFLYCHRATKSSEPIPVCKVGKQTDICPWCGCHFYSANVASIYNNQKAHDETIPWHLRIQIKIPNTRIKSPWQINSMALVVANIAPMTEVHDETLHSTWDSTPPDGTLPLQQKKQSCHPKHTVCEKMWWPFHEEKEHKCTPALCFAWMKQSHGVLSSKKTKKQ